MLRIYMRHLLPLWGYKAQPLSPPILRKMVVSSYVAVECGKRTKQYSWRLGLTMTETKHLRAQAQCCLHLAHETRNSRHVGRENGGQPPF